MYMLCFTLYVVLLYFVSLVSMNNTQAHFILMSEFSLQGRSTPDLVACKICECICNTIKKELQIYKQYSTTVVQPRPHTLVGAKGGMW